MIQTTKDKFLLVGIKEGNLCGKHLTLQPFLSPSSLNSKDTQESPFLVLKTNI